MSAVDAWIRPWFPAGWEGHIAADCPRLLDQVSEPAEGPGWLDPDQGVRCVTCLPPWDAECGTCHAAMSQELEEDEPFSEAAATRWKTKHRCFPTVRVIPPPRPELETIPAGQALLPIFEESTS